MAACDDFLNDIEANAAPKTPALPMPRPYAA